MHEVQQELEKYFLKFKYSNELISKQSIELKRAILIIMRIISKEKINEDIISNLLDKNNDYEKMGELKGKQKNKVLSIISSMIDKK